MPIEASERHQSSLSHSGHRKPYRQNGTQKLSGGPRASEYQSLLECDLDSNGQASGEKGRATAP